MRATYWVFSTVCSVALLWNPVACVADSVTLAIPARPQLVGSFMNEGALIVGVDNADRAASHTFIHQSGTVKFIGTPRGATNEIPTDVNDAGAVVGEAYVASVAPHGAQFSDFRAYVFRNGTFTMVPLPNSHAYGINNAGDVVGYYSANPADRTRRAFLYRDGRVTDLGSLGGNGGAAATKINSAGQITGSSATAKGNTHAFLYSKGAMTDLGTLAPAPNERSGGVDINDAGQVIGYSTHAGRGLHAFIYENDAMRDLGTLNDNAGGDEVTAFKINNVGTVVGTAVDARSRYRAFVYRNGELIDLNTLIEPSAAQFIELQSATSINDRGVILAGGIDSRTGMFASYLVTPRSFAAREPVPNAPATAGQSQYGSIVRISYDASRVSQ